MERQDEAEILNKLKKYSNFNFAVEKQYKNIDRCKKQ